MYSRDIRTMQSALGLSLKEACDFSAAGYLKIITILEGKAKHAEWARELLTAERRAYIEKFAQNVIVALPIAFAF